MQTKHIGTRYNLTKFKVENCEVVLLALGDRRDVQVNNVWGYFSVL